MDPKMNLIEVDVTDPELYQLMNEWMSISGRMSMHDYTHFARSAGLTLVQMNVLLHLYHRGPSGVMDFIEIMQVSPAAASQMVDRMTHQGLVRREESTVDRRVRMVHLTEHGHKLLEDSLHARHKWLDGFMASLSTEEAEKLTAALQLLNTRVRSVERQK